MSHTPHTLRRDLMIAGLAAAAAATHVLESALPGFGPWLKPGLANVFTVAAFFTLGWRAALSVTLIRLLASALALGTFLSPGFFIGLSGAMGAVAVMGAVHLLRMPVGPVGLSLLAALAHMSCQISAAYLLFFDHVGLFALLPWFLVGAWITGVLNGLLAFRMQKRLTRIVPATPLSPRRACRA